MTKHRKDKKNDRSPNIQLGKAKAFQEVSEEFLTNPTLKEMQPSPQPKDFDDIEY
ncbi:hypothetical protein [Lederbergia lenta]|uniref:Uncharacterized protein n=1 Tax=Lederbergia lenta TaxID=1467 RepID=A0A2X4WVQ4_LEDLE|nr:hypothetical protein [Lederbergia lenta]MCM3113029.1 hypothetical protein [Lederbergia lenta]MEC2322755.1 hypothetical protein [Lederbergia lenta]SQI61790.1 Uncharacterised protein [Lederbergia lenta]